MTQEEIDQAEQDALDKKNAVFADHPSTVDLAAPDKTNLDVAAAMDRSDLGQRVGFGSRQYREAGAPSEDVLRSKRDANELMDGAIVARREALNKGLAEGYDIDAPARALSPGRRKEMLHESVLLGEQAHREASIAAGLRHDLYRQDKDIQTATDVHDFFAGLPAIDKLPAGSPQKAAAFMNHLAAHPDAATTSLVKDLAKTYATTHDSAAVLAKAVEDYKKVHPDYKITSTGMSASGPSVHGRPIDPPKSDKEKTLPASVATKYAALQGELVKHTEAAAKQEARDVKANRPDVPYAEAEKLHKTQAEISELEKRFPSLAPAPQGQNETPAADNPDKVAPATADQKPISLDEYTALPEGSRYLAPDGTWHTKLKR